MNFITLSFAFFFLFVLGAGALFRKGTPTYKVFLLSFNLLFYGLAGISFVPLLLFVALMNWFSAKFLFTVPIQKQKTRKNIIGINILIHVLVLSFYKYYEFFLLSMESGLNYFGINIPIFSLISTTDLLFPVGLSFYTFQGLSYSIDHYRNPQQKPESFFDVLLFVSFFPTILAGPILRGHEFFSQLNGDALKKDNEVSTATVSKTKYSSVIAPEDKDSKENIVAQSQNANQETSVAQSQDVNNDIVIGFSFILSGLFKKVVLASYLSEHIVRDVFLTPDLYSSPTILVAIYAYAMQIYCDFSGYSDIAVGIGRLMGYKLPQNFNAPYLACSLQDFWRRWHITLSLWLRDYLYIPLGGNKKGNKSLNLIITMTLGGLWHGSHLRFLIWGFMHGMGLAVVYLWQKFVLYSRSKIKTLTGDKSKTSKLEISYVENDTENDAKNHAENQSKELENNFGSHIKNQSKDLAENQAISQAENQSKDFAENQVEKLAMSVESQTANQTTSQTENKKSEQNKTKHNNELLVLQPLSQPNPSLFTGILKRLKMLIGWFITFHFVSFLWVFFRAEDTHVAFEIITRVVAFNSSGDGFPALALVAIFLTMFLQFFGPYIFRFFVRFLDKLWSPVQVLCIAVACAIILKLGPDGVLPFIYFQF